MDDYEKCFSAAQQFLADVTARWPAQWWISSGMGDVLAFSGLVICLVQRYGSVRFPCEDRYRTSVESIFAQHPEVEVISLAEGRTLAKCEPVDPGVSLVFATENAWAHETAIDFYEYTYQRFGIPYEERWDSSPVAAAVKLVPQVPVPSGEYSFVHDDIGRGFAIDTRSLPARWFRPTWQESILAYADVIENAAQVDCIDSAMFHLANQLRPKGKLVLHRYAKPYRRGWNDYVTRNHAWTILK